VLARTNLLLWRADVRRRYGEYVWKFDVSTASRDNSLTALAAALTTGTGLWTLESAPDMEAMRTRSRIALESGETGYEQRFRIVSGGKVHWLSESAAIERIADDRWNVFGSVTDITSQMKADAALRKSEGHLHRILDRPDCMLWEARVVERRGAKEWSFDVPDSGLRRRIFGGKGPFVLHDTSGPDAKYLFSGTVPERAEMDMRLDNALRDGHPGYEQEFHLITPARTFVLQERVSIYPVGKKEWHIVGLVVDVTERTEAQEARRESQQRLESILDSVDCVLWQAQVKEAEGGRLEWFFPRIPSTRLFRRIFGEDPPANKHTLWTPDDVPDQEALDRRSTDALRSGAAGYSQEFKIRRGAGSLWLREQVAITAVEPGRWNVVGVVTDVTARHEAEEKHQETQAQLEEILDKADCVLWQARVTARPGAPDFDWLFYKVPKSQLYRRMFNRDPCEDKGELWWPAERPDAAEMDRASTEALRNGAQGYEQEFRIHVGGKTFWLHEHTSVTRIETGVWLVAGVTVDISARRAVEAALAAEKERLAVTLSAMDEGVITIDLSGTVQYMNPVAERLTACAPGAGVGRPMQQVFLLGDIVPGRKQVAWQVERVLGEGRTIDLPPQAMLYGAPGQLLPIEGCCAPVRNDRGETAGAVLVFRDVTVRQRLEVELMRASKLESIGVLAGGIAHDFNNLLTAIMGNVALAAVDSAQNLPIQEYLDGAQSASLRARDLTQQLLTFAKGGDPVRSAVQLSAVVVEIAEFAARGSKVKCEFDLAEDLWPADADKGQVGQIVQNLVLNAIQAMEGGGLIHISACNEVVRPETDFPLEPGNYVHISVADSGQGIQPQNLGKIFEPYFTTKEHGSGLGLATVYSIVRKHKGHISVESSLGKGATFKLWLPAVREGVRTASQAGRPQKSALKGRVLVMDDEKAIRVAASKILERFGLDPDTANDGVEAIEKFRSAHETKTPYSLVVMDLTVPGGMGGAEALVEMRKIDPDVKAIVSSGYSSNPVMGNYEKFGFRGVLAKPYGYDDFGRVLGEVMAPDAEVGG
jgi:signal transduction histidine kinase/ActR/RegA family two-component response regulator